jgi:transcriptional regulator with XRE-family HTH domain
MIGSKIRRIREMMGKTQNEIAKEINMTHQAYSRMERGESSISTNKLEQIAEALGVLVEDIYKFEDGNITISNNNNHGEAKENAFQLHFTVNKNDKIIEHLERTISNLQEEVKYLRAQLDKLTDSVSKK